MSIKNILKKMNYLGAFFLYLFRFFYFFFVYSLFLNTGSGLLFYTIHLDCCPCLLLNQSV